MKIVRTQGRQGSCKHGESKRGSRIRGSTTASGRESGDEGEGIGKRIRKCDGSTQSTRRLHRLPGMTVRQYEEEDS